MKTKATKITLLSHTQNPLETIYAEWVQSRSNDPVPDPSFLRHEIISERVRIQSQKQAKRSPEDPLVPINSQRPAYGPLETKMREAFEQVVSMKMPLGEHVQFIWLIENCPIVLREQLVRHRIGHKFGERLGADIIPDLAGGSSFWSQTTRIVDMGKFAEEGDYHTPGWISERPDALIPYSGPRGVFTPANEYEPEPPMAPIPTIGEEWHADMLKIQGIYQKWQKWGMPLEDARFMLPVAMQHRLSWSCNLVNLFHVLSRRGCWLAQLGVWQPIIEGIVEELATKIDPYFRRLIDPPCFDSKGNFDTCAFKKENDEIVDKGEYPPCSLWVNNDEAKSAPNVALDKEERGEGFENYIVGKERMPRYNRMQEKFTKLWGRDTRTGERKVLA